MKDPLPGRDAIVRLVAVVVLVAAGGAAAVFSFVPLLVLIARALGLPRSFEPAVLVDVASAQNLAALGNTLACSLGAVVVAVCWGAPLAFLVERTDVPGRRALVALGTLPLAVPPYLLAMALLSAMGPRTGLLGRPLADAGLLFPVAGRFGIALVLGVAFSPLVLLRVRAALARMDASLEEAARTSGASPARALLDHTLPLVMPSVFSSAALVFVASAAAFGVPALLGLSSEPRVLVLTTRIYTSLQVATPEAVREALALSLLLALVAGAAFVVPALLTRGRSRVVVTGKAARPARIALGRARLPAGVAAHGLAAALVLAPLGALILQAFVTRLGAPLSLENLGTSHFADLLSRAEVAEAAVRSLVLASSAAALCVVLGTTLTLLARRAAARFFPALAALAELPYALPGTVVAIALLLTFSTEIRVILFDRVTLVLALAGGGGLLFVAYCVKYAALALRGADEALAQLHPSLEEAARTSGASAPRAFLDATLPLLSPHLVAAFLAVFLPLLTELTMSVLLVAPGAPTLGTLLFELNDYGDPQEAAALASAIVVVVLVVAGLSNRIRRRSARGPDRV